ncbi:MAG: hypothetical protein EOO87_15700 [Pedobacter sp.]|nr:MAG: hypothetical protein EOO87_15700 [Pedobacter sp.]
MKKILLLLSLLSCIVFAHAQSAWVTKKLDDKIAVKFPEEPTKTVKNTSESYIVKGKDSIQYSATVLDYKALANLDSTMLAPIKDTQQFADQMMAGMASQKPNYTFGDAKIGKWKNYTTYTFSGVDNTSKKKLSVQMILIGSKMYALTCLVPDKLVTKNDGLFINSAELLK